MAIKILEVKKESCPATLFIGKRCRRQCDSGLWDCNHVTSRCRTKKILWDK